MSTIRDLENVLRHMTEVGPVGCSVAVSRGEETLVELCCGHADAARQIPLRPDHVFRMFSLTKVVSALCGLIQFERGVFKLDDPVSEYLPEYKHMHVQLKREDGGWDVVPSKVPITMRHAFSMGVGMLPWGVDGPVKTETQKIREKLGGPKTSNKYDHLTETRALAGVPMIWEPGTHWQYGQGLELMTAVVEVTSGMRLGDFMHKNIFEPLGMKDTGYRLHGDMAQRLVEAVRCEPDGTRVATPGHLLEESLIQPDAIYESAAMGLLSTLEDFAKFGKMLACGGQLGDVRIVGRKSLHLMRQNMLSEQQLEDFRAFHYMPGYGYGMGVRTMMDLSQGSNGSLGEYGWNGLLGTWLSIDPEEKTSIVYMQQVFPDIKAYTHPRIRAVVNGML